jgi:hypothetical protein
MGWAETYYIIIVRQGENKWEIKEKKIRVKRKLKKRLNVHLRKNARRKKRVINKATPENSFFMDALSFGSLSLATQRK